MRLVRRSDGYWIAGHDPVMGPYGKKRDALEDLRGVRLFYENENNRRYFVSEK